MKPIKELLELLLDQYQNHPDDDVRYRGLCFAVKRIYHYNLINLHEREVLLNAIELNRPYWAYEMSYWWPIGKTEHRIKFLKQLIKKYETQCQSK